MDEIKSRDFAWFLGIFSDMKIIIYNRNTLTAWSVRENLAFQEGSIVEISGLGEPDGQWWLRTS